MGERSHPVRNTKTTLGDLRVGLHPYTNCLRDQELPVVEGGDQS